MQKEGNATEPMPRGRLVAPRQMRATLDQRQSSARLTNRARMGFNLGAGGRKCATKSLANHLLGGHAAGYNVRISQG